MTNNIDNLRRFCRVSLNDVPLCGNIKILEYEGKSINSKESRICVIDISAGGLCFLSCLNFPINNDDIVFEVTLRILDKTLTFKTNIIRQTIIDEYLKHYKYGCKFVSNETLQQEYVQILNRFAVLKKKNNKPLKSCSFCDKNYYPCLSTTST